MQYIVYSKNPIESCIFCAEAVALLEEQKLPFIVKKLDEDFTRENIVQDFPSMKTYPIITQFFDDGDGCSRTYLIGGYRELLDIITRQKING